MMGRLNREQKQLFYEFRLDEAVPEDHLVRRIAGVLDLSWVHTELAPYYSLTGRPSIDPVLMIRMLIVGYVFAIRSERQICREVQVNLAYRWFCELGLEDQIPELVPSVDQEVGGSNPPSCTSIIGHFQASRLIGVTSGVTAAGSPTKRTPG